MSGVSNRMVITISNLFPRPDYPTRGMFNFQLFREVNSQLALRRQDAPGQATGGGSYLNICLVPEWRLWKWSAIRRWSCPFTAHCPLPTVYLPVFYLPFIGRSINGWFYYRALRRYFAANSPPCSSRCPQRHERKEAAEDSSYYIFLASWLYPDAAAVARLAKDLDVPVWLRVHGTDRFHLKNRWRRRLILKAVDYAQGVICNCKSVANDLVNWGVPVNKLHILANGIDTSLFRYRDKEELLGAQAAELLRENKSPEGGMNNLTAEQLKNSRIILFIGNLVPIKGPDVMLRAFAALSEVPLASYLAPELLRESPAGSLPSATQQPGNLTTCMPPPRLLVIGNGPERERLGALARQLGIAHRVHFLGNRPHAEVALWMNVADVLCLTSHSEGMPNVVMEALASGLPVVATEVGACRELLAEHPSARLCSPGDTAGIAQALEEVLFSCPDRPSLSRGIGDQRSWSRQAQTLIEMIGHPRL